LAQKHQEQADWSPTWVGLGLVWVIHLPKASALLPYRDWGIVSSKAAPFYSGPSYKIRKRKTKRRHDSLKSPAHFNHFARIIANVNHSVMGAAVSSSSAKTSRNMFYVLPFIPREIRNAIGGEPLAKLVQLPVFAMSHIHHKWLGG
jgi:hypothetical protein